MWWMGVAAAATWTVQVEGGTHTDLQTALDDAADGDRIEVGPGTWIGPFNPGGKDLSVVGVQGAELTILDGQGVDDQPVWNLDSGEPVSFTLQGFTITGGTGRRYSWDTGTGWMGGGVHLRESSATIRDCVFTGNVAVHTGQSVGAGVALIGAELVLEDTVFSDNTAYYGGGGVVVINGTATLTDVAFSGNTGNRGGALAVVQGSHVDLVDSTFTDNVGGTGGAIWVKDATVSSTRSTLSGNRAWHSGGTLAVQDGSFAGVELHLRDGQAEYDGGHVALIGGQLQLWTSTILGGRARAGGGIMAREAASAVTLDGVGMGDNQATAGGGDVWLAQGTAALSNVTSWMAQARDGAFVWLGAGATATVVNAVVVSPTGSAVQGVGAVTLDWSYALFEDVETWFGGVVTEVDATEGAAKLIDPGAGDFSAGSAVQDAGDPGILDRDGSRSDLGATGGPKGL
jgi:hypothetical protein